MWGFFGFVFVLFYHRAHALPPERARQRETGKGKVGNHPSAEMVMPQSLRHSPPGIQSMHVYMPAVIFKATGFRTQAVVGHMEVQHFNHYTACCLQHVVFKDMVQIFYSTINGGKFDEANIGYSHVVSSVGRTAQRTASYVVILERTKVSGGCQGDGTDCTASRVIVKSMIRTYHGYTSNQNGDEAYVVSILAGYWRDDPQCTIRCIYQTNHPSLHK